MKKGGFFLIVSVVILLVVLVKGKQGKWKLPEIRWPDDQEEEEEPEEETEPVERVVYNAWIIQGKEESVRFLAAEGEEELPVQTPLTEEVSGVTADLFVRDDVIWRVVLKPERITGKVLRLESEEGLLELAGYGMLELSDELAVYDLRGEWAEKGAMSQIVLGYEAADFVVAEGKVSAVLLAREIVPETIRVVLKTGDYQSFYHDEIRVTLMGAGEARWLDGEGEEQSKELPAGREITLIPGRSYLQNGRCSLAAEEGIRVDTILRGGKGEEYSPVYQGVLEITAEEPGLRLVNEVDLETYLKGVLPSEMPSSFGEEALRAQAVCARSYAYRQLLEGGRSRYGAHVDDSTSYQVYMSRKGNATTDAAVEETEGQVLLWEGEPALTSYYSTSCGVSSPAEKVWIGMAEVPYLIGKWQTTVEREPVPDLSEEEAFRTFLMEEEELLEKEEAWYRWKVTIANEDIRKSVEAALPGRLAAVPELIQCLQDGEYVSMPVEEVGEVRGIRVLQREREGLVTAIEIEGAKNTIRVFGEYNIRLMLAPLSDRVVRKDDSRIAGMTMLPSAYLLFEEKEEDGVFSGVVIRGGGYGHGVGLSQYGAGCLAELGWNYRKILAHYYPGTELTFLY